MATFFTTLALHSPPIPPPLQSSFNIQLTNSTLLINGPSTLSGHVPISGSKNSSLSILAATLCCSGTSKLYNVPAISDIAVMGSVLSSLGAKADTFGESEMVVNASEIGSVEPCLDEVSRIRGGFFVLGPLLGRFGQAVVGLPGGCDIGSRPIDLYVRGLHALGAVVEIRVARKQIMVWKGEERKAQADGKVSAYAANGKRLIGGRFHLDFPSVGATQTLMMAASLADGETVLSNVAKEPEVTDLAHFLIESGACIEGAGTDKIVIKGRKQLHGSEWVISPDRIEAGTFMIAAAITRSCVSMSPIIPSHLSFLIDKLTKSGCKITLHSHDTLEVSAIPARGYDMLQGFDVKTGPFPGFPTDLQPQTLALLTTCNGSSFVEESVFEKRMGHARELRKLGARIWVSGSTALVYGKENGKKLHGSRLTAEDLRGGASLVLAGLAAEGTTEVSGVIHIDRGYENLDRKLQALGAPIERLSSIPV